MLRALAKNGGVLHLNFGSYFLSDSVAAALDARKAAFKTLRLKTEERLGPDVDLFATDDPLILSELTAIRAAFVPQNATLADVVAQIRYAVDLVGIDHVGYGSDYDGVRDVPVGLEDVSTYPRLTEALLAAGFSKTDIAKISGGNLLRVWRQVLAARHK